MKIFIRADGGNTIGLGHIIRMLVLAKELKKTNKVIFLCRSSITSKIVGEDYIDKKNQHYVENDKFKAGIEKIKENGFEILTIAEESFIEDIISLQKEYNVDLIITDSYCVDEIYFDKLKPYFKINGYVDDVNRCRMNVDFIINQNINAKDINYTPNININTKLFLGTEYCMLREEFRKEYNNREITDQCGSLLLTLGGMDNNFNTLKILKYIINIDINIHVVIGKAFNENLIKELYNLSKKYRNINLYEDPNMSRLMKKCDVAISACGSTLHELCAMNVPTIGIILAENQELVAMKMKKEKLIAEAYWINKIKEYDLLRILGELINNKALRGKIITKQRQVVNINGVKLLASEINNYRG